MDDPDSEEKPRPTMDGLRVLALDDGGIRGLTQLLVLQEIMKRTQSDLSLNDEPYPFEQFDIIAGSGLGGIIALFLGPLRMRVSDAISSYQELFHVFSAMKKRGDTFFSATRLEAALRHIITKWDPESTENTDMQKETVDEPTAKTFVCAAPAYNPKTTLNLRTYKAQDDVIGQIRFIEAALATSASQPLLKSVQINGGSVPVQLSGPFMDRNPVVKALEEAARIFPQRPVACIISLGCGQASIDDIHPSKTFFNVCGLLRKRGRTSKLSEYLGDVSMDCERIAEETAARLSENKMSQAYYRFNVEHGLEDVLVEQKGKIGSVVTHTKHYMRAFAVDRSIDAAVLAIVERRATIVPTKVEKEKPVSRRPSWSGDNTHFIEHWPAEKFLERVREREPSSENDLRHLFLQLWGEILDPPSFIVQAASRVHSSSDLLQDFSSILPRDFAIYWSSEPNLQECAVVSTPNGAYLSSLSNPSANLPPVKNLSDLYEILSSETGWELLVDVQPPWTSGISQLLQLALDSFQNVDQRRNRALRLLRKIAKAHSVLPPSFLLRGAVCVSENALSGGGFADIWKGRLGENVVCLKVLRIFATNLVRARVFDEFADEALVWRQLSHPNVLPFLGVSTELFSPTFCLVSPFMENGNIMAFLERHTNHNRMKSIIEIAQGLVYLHQFDPQIVHGDIRGANILVKDDLSCCLADFGLAVASEVHTSITSSVGMRGTTRWMAPEVMAPDMFPSYKNAPKTARDVYAFACTILEICTGEVPFNHQQLDPAVMLEVLRGLRPERPALFPDELWSLVGDGWNGDATLRPSMVEALDRLESMDIHLLYRLPSGD